MLAAAAKVLQSCPTLCDPIDGSLSGSSVHGILQARTLEGVAIPFSRGSSRPRDQTWVSCIVGRRFTVWATREVHHWRRDLGKKKNQNTQNFWFELISFIKHINAGGKGEIPHRYFFPGGWVGGCFAPYFEITVEVLTSELLGDQVTCSRVFSCLWN